VIIPYHVEAALELVNAYSNISTPGGGERVVSRSATFAQLL